MQLWKKFDELTITKKLRMAFGSTITFLNRSGVESSIDLTELSALNGLTATAAELNMAADSSANAVVLASTKAVSASESGSTFFLSASTEFVSTLPAPAIGLRYTFIVAAAPSGASYTVVSGSSANIIKGLQQSVAGDAGDSGTADDTITFVDGQSVAGDRVDLISDGTSWFAYANSKVAAGITFTQAT